MTKIKMTKKAREAANSLAVRYQAYMAASDRCDNRGGNTKDLREAILWGEMLIEIEKEIGVEMLGEDLITSVLNTYRKRLDDAKRAIPGIVALIRLAA